MRLHYQGSQVLPKLYTSFIHLLLEREDAWTGLRVQLVRISRFLLGEVNSDNQDIKHIYHFILEYLGLYK